MATEVGVGFVSIIPSTKGFGASLAAQGAAAGKGAGRATGEAVQRSFGTKMKGAGKAMTAGVTLPLVGLGVAATKAAGDFSKGMANIATLIPGNTERVKELGDGIKDLGPTVGKSSSDLTDGLYQVISAFGDSAESMSLLETNARAATAGLATTEEAINLTSAVTKGFGDTSAEAVQKASDLALMTVRLGQTTFPELASSVGQVIPIAQNLNVSQEELFGTMATFTGVTGNASEVSTQMRSALQSLMKPTASASKVLSEAGYESGAAAIKALGFKGALGLMTDAAQATGEPLGKYIGRVEGQTVALGLAGAQSDVYNEKLTQMGSAAGTTDEAFKEVSEGVGKQAFQWEQFKVQLQTVLVSLGEGLLPALGSLMEASKPLIDIIKQVADAFAAAPGPVQTIIVGIGAFIAIAGPLMWAIGGITGAVTALNLAFLANPITWIILAVVALVAAVVYAWNNFEWFRDAVLAVWEAIKVAAEVVWNAIYAVIEFVVKAVVTYVTAYWTVLSTVVGAIWDGIRAYVEFQVNLIRSVIEVAVKAIGWVWENVFVRIANIVSSVFEGIRSGVQGVVDWIKGILEWISGAISTVMEKLGPITGVLGSVAGGLGDLFGGTFHNGGTVPGSGDVPILAQGGEVVMNRRAASTIGRDNLNRANQGDTSGLGGGPTYNITVNNAKPEPASDSLPNAVRKSAYLSGV